MAGPSSTIILKIKQAFPNIFDGKNVFVVNYNSVDHILVFCCMFKNGKDKLSNIDGLYQTFPQVWCYLICCLISIVASIAMAALFGLQIKMWKDVHKRLKWCNTTIDDNRSVCECIFGQDESWKLCRFVFLSTFINFIEKGFHIKTQCF